MPASARERLLGARPHLAGQRGVRGFHTSLRSDLGDSCMPEGGRAGARDLRETCTRSPAKEAETVSCLCMSWDHEALRLSVECAVVSESTIKKSCSFLAETMMPPWCDSGLVSTVVTKVTAPPVSADASASAWYSGSSHHWHVANVVSGVGSCPRPCPHESQSTRSPTSPSQLSELSRLRSSDAAVLRAVRRVLPQRSHTSACLEARTVAPPLVAAAIVWSPRARKLERQPGALKLAPSRSGAAPAGATASCRAEAAAVDGDIHALYGTGPTAPPAALSCAGGLVSVSSSSIGVSPADTSEQQEFDPDAGDPGASSNFPPTAHEDGVMPGDRPRNCRGVASSDRDGASRLLALASSRLLASALHPL
eukprot:scaffold28826_cov253-Isochrysis_galbana.AAC.5